MNNKKVIAFLVISVLILTVTVFAAENAQKIEAYLANNLNFIVDGTPWSPKDVDGSPLTPILFKGRTYVPVRSLLEDKGVTVGYIADTQSVILDYSTMEPQSTVAAYIKIQDIKGETTDRSAKLLTIQKNPNFDLKNISFTQEYTFDLVDTSILLLDGKQIEGTRESQVRTSVQWPWPVKSASIEIDEATGVVNSVNMISEDASSTGASSKVTIEIEISGPPFKLKITIRF